MVADFAGIWFGGNELCEEKLLVLAGPATVRRIRRWRSAIGSVGACDLKISSSSSRVVKV